MALLAVVASFVLANANEEYCSYYSGYCDTELNTAVQTYGAIQAAAAGLAGLEFVLFIISTVLTSVTIHRHRSAGGHCKALSGGVEYVSAAPAPAYQQGGAQPGEKYEMHSNGQVVGQTYVPEGGAQTYQAVPGAQHYQPGVSPA